MKLFMYKIAIAVQDEMDADEIILRLLDNSEAGDELYALNCLEQGSIEVPVPDPTYGGESYFKWLDTANGLVMRELVGVQRRRELIGKVMCVPTDSITRDLEMLTALETKFYVIQVDYEKYYTVVNPDEMFTDSERAYWYAMAHFEDVEEALS